MMVYKVTPEQIDRNNKLLSTQKIAALVFEHINRSDDFQTLALDLTALEETLTVRLFSNPFQLISWTRPPLASCKGAPK